MSVYDNFADSPNQIRKEGQEITIKFQRTGENTARISWNIPPPAHGCSSDNLAYDGIVVTISNTPANYISTSPKDGIYYDADPTADYDLHVGSVIDKAYVVGAFYHDKTTTYLDVTGIQPKTPYYVSGYAVDAVGRYYREGVHAYSLPTGTQSYVAEDYPAAHAILITSTTPTLLQSRTGLLPNVEYNLPIKIECETKNFTINGTQAQVYGQLVDAINAALVSLESPYSSPLPPKTGNYLKDTDNSFYFWDGSKLSPATVLQSNHDPLNPIVGAYWLNSESGVLQEYTILGWQVVADVISSASAPTELAAYTVWFDGTVVRVWENGHWCDYTTVISDRNPQLPPKFSAGDFWFNEADSEIFKWNDILKKWDDALVIYYDKDPNTFVTGEYWYDETNSKVKRFTGTVWTAVAGTLYKDSQQNGELSATDMLAVSASTYWFDTRLQKFYQRNLMNTEWVEYKFVSFPVNPRNRKSCDLWWNSSPSVDDLFVWEQVSASWVPVNNFIRQATDPNLPPVLDEHTAWVDYSDAIYLITPTDCRQLNYISSAVNPSSIQEGTLWVDDNGVYRKYVSGEWVELNYFMSYYRDPYSTFYEMLWFDSNSNILYKIGTSMSWIAQCLHFARKDILPALDSQWYNIVDKVLFKWSGSAWLPISPAIKLEFHNRTCADKYDALVFSTRKTGCYEAFEVLSENNTLLASLSTPVIYTDPLDGGSEVDAGPMYMQIGVGDDGSPDERRALQEEIRLMFGAPSVGVELTKAQIDVCINNALLVLRKRSTYAYKKAMFFLDLKPNQQVYTLSNRCVGFNKIVDVSAIHRTKAGAFKTAYSQNDNFAYAALQQLYTLGTFDMLTFHLTSSYVEELEVLFASRIMYQWLERKRELKIYQIPRGKERVLIEATIERTEQELLSDRETAYWLKRWAIVEAKSILAQTRGKFATLPGPNGNTTLNASELQSQVETERQALIDEIESFAMQDLVDVGMKAHFVIG